MKISFNLYALGNLDWPPRVQVGRAIRLYDPADRALFLKDGRVRTEYVRDTPVPSRDWRRWFAINSTTFNAETARPQKKTEAVSGTRYSLLPGDL